MDSERIVAGTPCAGRRWHRVSGLVAGLILGLAWTGAGTERVHAGDPETEPGVRSPWSKGVDADERDRAGDLFVDGNRLLKDRDFAAAVSKYEQALKLWDHPRIHYNRGLALMRLERTIDAYHAFTAAMRHGPEALDPEKYEQAQSYHDLLGQQLATIEIVCDEPGAEVTLDGAVIFTGPGRHDGLIKIGEHRIIASKQDYVSAEQTKLLTAGEEVSVHLHLLPFDQVYETKTPPWYWRSWIMVGAGTAVAAAGGVLQWRASADYARYDSELEEICGDNNCPGITDPDVLALRDRAQVEEIGSYVAYGVGAAAMATGLVLAYVHRPKLVRRELDQAPASVSVGPLAAPNTAGLTALIRF
ncbi:hypothetical protein [Haliangium sp.]|uniref:hypothetical protein n=1 Tax=Haliangium sp. TaxID=2663208 RepID=UPI003D10A234